MKTSFELKESIPSGLLQERGKVIENLLGKETIGEINARTVLDLSELRLVEKIRRLKLGKARTPRYIPL